MRLRTGHKRAQRKSQGRIFPRADLKRFVLSNKYAASKDCFWKWREEWYVLKDGILSVFGRARGLALQTWYSYAYDFGYDDGCKDGAVHEHILQRISLRGRDFHCPTGHFSYWNSLTGYHKHTEEFENTAKQCVEKLTGRKRDQPITVDEIAAKAAARTLLKRYRWTLLHVQLKPRPRIRYDGFNNDAERDAWRLEQAQREKERMACRQAELAAQVMTCVWCCTSTTGDKIKWNDGREYCSECYQKVFRSTNVPAELDIPF